MSLYFEGWGQFFEGWGTADAPADPPASGGGGGGGLNVYISERELERTKKHIDEALARYAPEPETPAPLPELDLPGEGVIEPEGARGAAEEGFAIDEAAMARAVIEEANRTIEGAKEFARALIDQAQDDARRLERERTEEEEAKRRERRRVYAALMTAIIAADD